MAKDEQTQVEKLQKAIHDEKVAKMARKQAEREAALKVIQENEAEKVKREKQQHAEKQSAADLLKTEIKAMEAREKKRLDEVQARSAKIQARLDNMGEAFKGHDKELQLRMEREYLAGVLKQDEENALNEKLRKLQKKERD